MLKLFNLKLSDRVKNEFKSFLRESDLVNPRIGLVKWSTPEDSTEYWGFGGYELDKIIKVKEEYEEQGYEVFYQIEEFEIVITQPDLLHELEGQFMDIEANRFKFKPQ
jgi:hypothetical protein